MGYCIGQVISSDFERTLYSFRELDCLLITLIIERKNSKIQAILVLMAFWIPGPTSQCNVHLVSMSVESIELTK